MVSGQTVIVILLVVSVVFSMLSLVITFSLSDLKPVQQRIVVQSPGNVPAGGVGLTVEPRASGGAP